MTNFRYFQEHAGATSPRHMMVDGDFVGYVLAGPHMPVESFQAVFEYVFGAQSLFMYRDMTIPDQTHLAVTYIHSDEFERELLDIAANCFGYQTNSRKTPKVTLGPVTRFEMT